MSGRPEFFSPDYATSRERFRQAARATGGRLEILPLDIKGPQDVSLSIDIAWFGAARPKKAVVHSSGLHGVEGFAGSAIQLQLLSALPSLPDGTALILAHVLNPFGMAWLRRVNAENVDLNRNCLEGDLYAGAPETYAKCDSFLNPPGPPGRDFYLLKAQLLVLRYGMSALKQAVAGGQYEFSRGLFFGGKRLQPEIAAYREFLQCHLGEATRVVAIDVHTGVGKFAEDLLLVDTPHFEAMQRLFGKRVCPLEPNRGAAYRVRGGLQSMIFGALDHAEVFFVGQEFGTYNPIKVVHALREENRWHQYGVGSVDHPSKLRLKQIFCPDDERWRGVALTRGVDLIRQGLRIVSNSGLI